MHLYCVSAPWVEIMGGSAYTGAGAGVKLRNRGPEGMVACPSVEAVRQSMAGSGP